MSEYRLTRDADADLLEIFVYGFETFGLIQAEDYRDSMTRCFELPRITPSWAAGPTNSRQARGGMSMGATLFLRRAALRRAHHGHCQRAQYPQTAGLKAVLISALAVHVESPTCFRYPRAYAAALFHTVKYFARGFSTTIALVDCSGSSCHSSDSERPMRSAPSRRNSGSWSSSFGQAG